MTAPKLSHEEIRVTADRWTKIGAGGVYWFAAVILKQLLSELATVTAQRKAWEKTSLAAYKLDYASDPSPGQTDEEHRAIRDDFVECFRVARLLDPTAPATAEAGESG